MPSLLKREHPELQNMKFLNFWQFLRTFFAHLYPDPDPGDQNQCGSGSETLLYSSLSLRELHREMHIRNRALVYGPSLPQHLVPGPSFQASHHLIPGLSSYPPHPLLHQSGSHFQPPPPPLFSEGFGPLWGPSGYPFDLPWSCGSNMSRPIRPIPQYPYAAPQAYSPTLFRPAPGDGFPTGSPYGRGSAFTRVSHGDDAMPMDGEARRERAEARQLEALRGTGDGDPKSESNGASRERRSVFAKVADSSSANYSSANYSSDNYSSANYSSANYSHSSGVVELPAAAASFASKNIVEQLVAADGSMLTAADGSLVDGSLLLADDSLLAVAARNLLGTAIFAVKKPPGLETSFSKFLAFLLKYLCINK
jgi:hypothetical protein